MLGIALEGGGAKGAYQAGAYIALKKKHIKMLENILIIQTKYFLILLFFQIFYVYFLILITCYNFLSINFTNFESPNVIIRYIIATIINGTKYSYVREAIISDALVKSIIPI